jgi:mannose-6-phosphate isomerase class I
MLTENFIELNWDNSLLYDLSDNPFPTQVHALLTGQTQTFPLEGSNCLVFVAEGKAVLTKEEMAFTLYQGMYANVGKAFELHVPEGKTMIIQQHSHRGLFQIGGPVEQKGRLRYIDGCSDTLLVPPSILGEPCFNLLHIPAHTFQSQHTHPSFRIGVILQGTGICKTPANEIPLSPGMAFVIPEEGIHSFVTSHEELLVVAYHPDSDFGPTHQNHPMINKTILHEVS